MKLSWKTLGFAVGSVVLLIIATAIVVVSQGPQGPEGPRGEGFRRGPGPRGGMMPMFRELNLTDDQKAQIKQIMESEAASTKELHEKLRALHASEPEPFSTTFDEAAVRAAAEARAKIDVELQVSHARAMSQIAAILTAEQKAQLAARKPQFREGPPPPPEP
ncbi:MAG TPA: Spy/CpxP family protein refolding chaperone [Pyrinomonadaceae bacterium]|nr:Spy/CpxP family protein refolding chaperone [Pyrinomonadaceae bacterium]